MYLCIIIKDKKMYILQIKNGKVEIRKEDGNILVRTIGNGDAISTDFNSDQSIIIITTKNGKVEIRKINGNLIRTIGNCDATNARYISSIKKLATRISEKNLNQDKLIITTAHIGINIETTFTDGTNVIKAWTIVAEGDIQRPHYRYLIK